jgi:hypothetical protein
MTRDELVERVREVARRLGKTTLKHKEFRAETKIGDNWIRRHFDGWSELCAAAGISAQRAFRLNDDDIFVAMKDAFEVFGGIGTRYQLARHFRYHTSVLSARWPDWPAVLVAFRAWVLQHTPDWRFTEELETRIAYGKSPGGRRSNGLQRKAAASPVTADGELPCPLPAPLPGEAPNRRPPTDAPAGEKAREIVEETTGEPPGAPSDTVPVEAANDQAIGPSTGPLAGPLVGDAIAYRGIMFAPTNEMGVALLFGAAALELGFMVEAARTQFPDCYAWRRVADGRRKRVRIEFEYASANFRLHAHDPKGCDLIVCWEHNWLKSPVPVFDLKKAIAALRLKGLGLA